MKTYKEILKNKIILERRQMSDDEGTNIIGVDGYGQNMPNMPTSPRGPQRTREYPGIVIHSVNTYTNGGKQRGRSVPDSPTIEDETNDFTADDLDYNKERESNIPATPFIAVGSGGYGLAKGAAKAGRVAKSALQAGYPLSRPLVTTIAKGAAKTAGKAFGRAVPFVGAAADLGLAAHDFSQGKYGRGLARGALAGLGFIPGVGWAINLAGNTLIDTLWEHQDTGYYQNKLIEKLDDKHYSKYMLSE